MQQIPRLVRHLAEGLAMGAANIIPGVSGGTMALILGLYERLIAATSDGVAAALSLARFRGREAADRLAALPWPFLAPIVVGMVTAPLLGAGWMEAQLEHHPETMRGVFFGLVAGSLAVPWMRIRDRKWALWTLAGLSAIIAWVLVGLPPKSAAQPTDFQVFGAAALAISAMVLPGVSGSFLLVVLGMYAPTLTALDRLDLRFIAVFGAGAAVGLAVFAVLLNWLLRRYHDATMAALVGLMAGSLRALWPWQNGSVPILPESAGAAVPVIAWTLGALAAGVAMASMEIRRMRRERRAAVSESV